MRWLVVVVVVLLVARTAVAAPPPDVRRPNESGLGAAQLLLGTGVVLLSELAMLKGADETHADFLAIPVVAIGPLIGGFVVCGIGSASRAYEGRCGPAVGGAYIGALIAIPAGFVGCYVNQGSSGGGDAGSPCAAGAIVAASVAYVIGTGVGACVGWHYGKRPRGERPPAVAAPAPAAIVPEASAADAWPELRARPAASGPQGTRLSLSLLSLRF
jgi:hypothetical protein